MKLTLTLAMDNAAFADNPGDEVARILTKLATKVYKALEAVVTVKTTPIRKRSKPNCFK